MNRTNRILKFIGILCLLLSFQSCENLSNENISIISIPNDSIQGQAFIGENNISVKYSPQGNFIQVIESDSKIWNNLIIEKSNQKIDSKLFFHDDDINVSRIYDSLSFGEYNLKFVSGFNDTITGKLNFEKNIELKFPHKLKEFYNEKEIKNLNIKKLTKNDTLQVLYKELGCFGASTKLIEFITNENNKITLRKKINRLRNEGEWIYSEKKDVKEELMEFVANIKNLNKNDKTYCSSKLDYIFRIKGTNTIYWVKDNPCKYLDEFYELIRT